jgi:hypothetical protein
VVIAIFAVTTVLTPPSLVITIIIIIIIIIIVITIATYNVLHNPVYKEKFAITWKFAMQHRHISSIKMSTDKGKSLIDNKTGKTSS